MKLAILGGGVSGHAAAELATELKMTAKIANDGEVTDMDALFDGAESVVVSPGVRPSSKLLQTALANGLDVISELEFGFRHFRGPVLAVTGTNGKTTTTELTVHLLTACGIPAIGCGNLGLPLSAVAARQMRGGLAAGTVAVAEVSSFQLERVRDFAPAAAAFLNLAEDHIDRYPGGFPEYGAVKRRIFDRVAPENRIWGLSFAEQPHRAVSDGTSVIFDGKEAVTLKDTQLSMPHNVENFCAALELVARIAPSVIFTPAFAAACTAFRLGRHRLETVAVVRGVRCIDDSKATNPASVAAALRTLGNTPVHLILGGLDKGVDFLEMLPLPASVKSVSLIGDCAPKLERLLAGTSSVRNFGRDFPACVRSALAAAAPGEILLLSPACASMDMFRDYVDRGDRFRELVQKPLL